MIQDKPYKNYADMKMWGHQYRLTEKEPWLTENGQHLFIKP